MSSPPESPETPTPAADSPQPTAPARNLAHRMLEWVVPAKNPGGSVFGLIAIGALLAAESAQHETYREVVGTSILALILYWFAHAYGDTVSYRIKRGTRLSARGVRRALIDDWPIMRGATAPLLALLIAWAAGASTNTAVLVALWTCVGCLIVFELAAGLRTGAGPMELLIEGSVGAAMGVAILALKVILK